MSVERGCVLHIVSVSRGQHVRGGGACAFLKEPLDVLISVSLLLLRLKTVGRVHRDVPLR